MTTDGWHTVYGYDVFVMGGYVVRATKEDHNGSLVTASVYRRCPYGGWDNMNGYVTLDTLRKGLKRGNYRIM